MIHHFVASLNSTWSRSWVLLKNLHLFAVSDLKTMICPVTLFGMLSAMAGEEFSTGPSSDMFGVLQRVPRTFVWVYLNVLIFAIANQRLPDSILEDKFNKPWRPIAAGNISPVIARRILLLLIPTGYLACRFALGSAEEFLLCTGGAWLYNDLGGADEHFIVRHLLNACAYIVYGSGAVRVCVDTERRTLKGNMYLWLFLIACVIFSTTRVQDLKDQKGDKARDRHTVPLAYGDVAARRSLAFNVLLWSFIAPWYWGLGLFTYWPTICLGLYTMYRALQRANPSFDRQTYLVWSWWLLSLFVLPNAKRLSKTAQI